MIDSIIHLPAIVKIGAVFLGILIVYRQGIPLGVSIIIHSLLLTFISGAGLLDGLLYQVQSLAKPEYWLLILVILLILFFTESLNNTGRMQRTITSLKQWLRNHTMLLAGLPALVGLLPMPGGAIFSAPFIHSIDDKQEINPAKKTAINYWFRHIWECWWPLYPGVIFAIHYSGLSAANFFGLMIYITPIAVGSGYLFLLRNIQKQTRNTDTSPLDLKAVSATFLPILLLISLAVGGSALLQYFHLKKIYANLGALLTGLIISLILILSRNPEAIKTSITILKKKKTFFLILVIIGVQSFSSTIVMPINDLGITLVSQMRDELITLGIPLVPVIILIPFISGVVTGVAFAFVGASFPLVFALIGTDAGFNVIAATTVLAYVSGYIGMIFSPVHICLVITSEYFKTSLFKVYPYLIGPSLIVFIFGIILSGFYYLVL